MTLADPHPEIAGRRKFRGPLVSVSENAFVMEVLLAPVAGEKPVPSNVSIRWDWVRKARLVPVFLTPASPEPERARKKLPAKAEVSKHEPGTEESH